MCKFGGNEMAQAEKLDLKVGCEAAGTRSGGQKNFVS